MTATGAHPTRPSPPADARADRTDEQVLVLGIGNLLWADEGFGVRAVEHFHRHYDSPSQLTCLDGGTQGLYLLQPIRDADVVVIFDAVDMGKPPGALCVLRDDEVPNYVSAKKLSLHQTGFQEVLALAALLRNRPPVLLLIGVQPVELEDYGGGLRPEVKAQLQPAVDMAVDFLARRGLSLPRRAIPRPEDGGPGCAILTADRYEQARPSKTEAWRAGDPRVICPFQRATP